MIWLTPLAWCGLVALTVPLVIHMLARHRAPHVVFPSLRFLRETQAAAVRRRVISDWPLLVVRALILIAATAAAAGPVLVSDARRASWNQRVARAVVTTDPTRPAVARIADEEAATAFIAARFTNPVLADGLREARDWLQQQPPAAREVVIVDDLREGALTAADLAWIPPLVGIRILPIAADSGRASQTLRAVADVADTIGEIDTQVTVDSARTAIRYGVARPVQAFSVVRVAAAVNEQAAADALLRAVMREGLWVPSDSGRRVVIAFDGAPAAGTPQPPTVEWMRRTLEKNPQVRGGELNGALLVQTNLRPRDEHAVSVVASVLRSAFDTSFEGLEPRRLSAATLTAWSRPTGASPPDAVPADEGDRRWFWALALVFIVIEQWLRRVA